MEQKTSDNFIPLNDVFSYGITKSGTAHIHMPNELRSLIQQKGLRYTLEFVNENLYDALLRLVEIADSNSSINNVFAVSPLLSEPEFRKRLEVLGFRTEKADKRFESYFPGKSNLYQGSISVDRLRKVLEIEKEMRQGMDQQDSIWHGRILSYKYEQLKNVGIIGHYGFTLDEIVDMGMMNYNYRHDLPLKTKSELKAEHDAEAKEMEH